MKGFAALLVLCVACGPAHRGDDDFGNGDASGGGGDAAGSGRGSDNETVYVYAHTASTLFRVDPDTLAITQVGNFVWPSGTDTMTDIAIQKTSTLTITMASDLIGFGDATHTTWGTRPPGL